MLDRIALHQWGSKLKYVKIAPVSIELSLRTTTIADSFWLTIVHCASEVTALFMCLLFSFSIKARMWMMK